MTKTAEDFRREANELRDKIEAAVDAGESLVDFFSGGVYGEDAEGRWIVGYGVWGGGGHVTLTPENVRVCGVESEPFTASASRELRELFATVENA